MLDIGCCAKFGGGGGFAVGSSRSVGAIGSLKIAPYILGLLKVLGLQLYGQPAFKSKTGRLTSLCCHSGFLQHGAAVSFV